MTHQLSLQLQLPPQLPPQPECQPHHLPSQQPQQSQQPILPVGSGIENSLFLGEESDVARSAQRKKKKRECNTCKQCRKSRSACSREMPCKRCVSTGRGDQCDWSDAKPKVILQEVQALSPGSFRAADPERFRLKEDFQNLHSRVDTLLNMLKQHRPTDQASVVTSGPDTVPVANYHVEDIATQLSRFTLNQAIPHRPVELPPTNPNLRISVKEVEEYVQEEERRGEREGCTFHIGASTAGPSALPLVVPMTSGSSAGPAHPRLVSSAATAPIIEGLLGIGRGPRTFEGIMALLPSHIQIKACLEQFEIHRAWMHRILHRPTFWWQVYCQIRDKFAHTDRRAQLHRLAVLFAVCGLGLFNNILPPADVGKFGLPTDVRAQREVALQWCRAATSCLEIGRFEEEPSMDSISAMAILAQLPLYTSNGETLGIALDFIGKAIDLAMKLDLHIDPDLHPEYRSASDLTKQNRRRLMIALLCQHYKMGGLLCQNWGLRPLERFATLKMPLDQFDEDYDGVDGRLKIPRKPGSSHTIMTGVRCRFEVSRIWQAIGILFADPAHPPVHERVLELDRALLAVEASWPALVRTSFDPATCSFTPPFGLLPGQPPGRLVVLIDRLGCFAVYAAAMVRLHRGFLMETDGVPPEYIKMHRQRVCHYGRSMLAIHRTKLFPLDNVPLQFFVLSSTITLAVYCLTAEMRDEEDERETVTEELEKVMTVLRKCTGMSSILRRTYAVLNFALNKLAANKSRVDQAQSRSTKRTRLDAGEQVGQAAVAPCDLHAQASKAAPEPSLDNTIHILKAQESQNENLQSMEGLLRFLMTQDVPWQEKFEMRHYKPLQSQQSGGEPTFMAEPAEAAHLFNFSSLLPSGSGYDTTTGASGMTSNYMSTPPASGSFGFGTPQLDYELGSSPGSLNYPISVSFSPNNPTDQQQQPQQQQPQQEQQQQQQLQQQLEHQHHFGTLANPFMLEHDLIGSTQVHEEFGLFNHLRESGLGGPTGSTSW